MKNNWLKNIRRSIALALMVVMTLVAPATPVMAGEVAARQISEWSIKTLNEGENYGIYPMEWYDDGFGEDISEDKLSKLLVNVETKISELGLEKDETFTPVEYEKDGTRGAVITGLYNSIATYKLPEELESGKDGAVEYMQNRHILNGTNKGLELETACSVEQAVVFSIRLVEDVYGAAEAGAKGLMWKVEKGDNTMYLLGSIHTGYSHLYPINKTVKDIFKESDSLIVEINMLNEQQEDAEAFMALAMYPDGEKLQDNVSEETYARLGEILEMVGAPTDAYDHVKPWVISNELTMMLYTDSDSEEGQDGVEFGVDMYFLATAMLSGKPVMELETAMDQGRMFDNVSKEQQEKQLNELLDIALDPEEEAASEVLEMTDAMFETWYQGDIDEFISLLFDEEDESEEDESELELFGKRDQAMTKKLITLLEDDGEATYFVVVGAGHFTEKDTIVDLLKAEGYTVERFWE